MPIEIDSQAEAEYTMPCAEAVLAGTLALMTGHARQPDEQVRHLMARKIASHLFFLAEHPHLSDNFRRMLANLRVHWQLMLAPSQEALADEACLTSTVPTPLWHGAAGVVQ